jgi:hypothetical protein
MPRGTQSGPTSGTLFSVRSPVSIALFFLLSAFFLFGLLAALNRSRKSLAIAGVCLVAVLSIIIFLTPVRLPSWIPINQKQGYQRYTGGQTTTTIPGSSDPSDSTTSSTLPGGGI